MAFSSLVLEKADASVVELAKDAAAGVAAASRRGHDGADGNSRALEVVVVGLAREAGVSTVAGGLAALLGNKGRTAHVVPIHGPPDPDGDRDSVGTRPVGAAGGLADLRT